jgi:radical SAM superfamily enzyme YgiQ (UPF0313 family)
VRILLVDPPGKNKGLNTGLAYLSAVLAERHEVTVLDLNNLNIGSCGDPNPDMSINELEDRIIQVVDDFQPALFGVSVKTFTAGISKHILKYIKARKPEILTVVGGPHITLDGSSYMQQDSADFGILGEGEYAFLELCNSLEKNESIENLEGLLFWQYGSMRRNPQGNPIKDLDALPLPSYDSFTSVAANESNILEYPILTSRGCPFRCSYCSMPQIMGRKWRSHSPRRVIDELKHAKEKYDSRSFTVVDDNFTLDLSRVEDIGDLLIHERINLPWTCQNGIRADRISEILARKMKRSGCRYVWIGIETADEEVFNTINKGERLEDIRTGIKRLKRAGIRVGGFFIVGLPYSKRESDLKSISFVKELAIDGWWFTFVPYPHTEAWDWVQTHARLLRSPDGALQFGTNDIEPIFETDDYSKEARMKTYDEIHIRLRHFDRLVDPSLSQRDKWPRVYEKLRPYGFLTISSFILFVLSRNLRSKLTRIHGGLSNRGH